MKHSLVLSALLTLGSLAGTAHAVPATAPHAAACVAALKANEAGLVATLKAGAPVESELQKVVRSGIAIIGSQYMAGLRESEARPLLDAADKDFEALPRSAAAARQAQCLQEGQVLYKNASGLEQNLIDSAAKKRIHKRLKAAA
jgi:hypothetical protein